MISHKHKFIFVHVSKTAGTTIRFALQGKYDELHDPHHSLISEIKEKLSEQVFQSYFKFGVVRNPWDREVSRYKFIKNRKCNSKHKYCQNGFNEYLFKFVELGLVNYDALKIDGKIGVDYIMKFENLQEDFDKICDKIGIPQRKLPHKNATKHKHYTEYYDDETKQIVAEKYVRDIEYFGYNFGD
jgi:hypothetical protein